MSDTQPNESSVPLQKMNGASELEGFTQIVSAIQSLPEDAQMRVMKSVLTFLGWTDSIPKRAEGGLQVTTQSPTNQSTFSDDRTPSAKTFMLEKRPITDIEKIACLAYYLTHYRATPHFKTLDLSKLNTEAAQVKFSNAAKAVDNATANGLLVQAGKGNKQISAMGELYVQALPDREAAKAAIAHARPRRKTKRGNSEADEAQAENQ
jgi:hypothetical protein